MSNFFEYFGKNMRSILGFAIVVLSFAFLFALLFIKMPTENKDLLTLASGIVLAGLGGVIGYYFGSSKDKSDQDKADIIQKQTT